MTSQIIPLLGIASPGYTPEPLRTITVNATREGQQTTAYKEAVLWPSLYDRTDLVTFTLKDGASATRVFAASAVDGKKVIMLYDFDDQPYGAVRTPNITADIVLNMDLNDGSGGGGASGVPAGADAVVRVDKLPASREIVAIEKTTTGEWRMAGNRVLSTGELEMEVTGGAVYTVGLDDYGIQYQGGLAVTEGQRIRPSTMQGWLYLITENGQLPAIEPEWWPAQGENAPRPLGTARAQAVRYYRPQALGPINYTLK